MHYIFCYGDSNTWGANHADDSQLPVEVLWYSILQKIVGDQFMVIGNGQPGRTIALDDPTESGRNGLDSFAQSISNLPALDMVIIMLGTNELKSRFDASIDEITYHMSLLIEAIRKIGIVRFGHLPYILVLAPPIIQPRGEFAPKFFHAQQRSQDLAAAFAALALARTVYFFDTNTVIHGASLDGLHLPVEDHALLGKGLAEFISHIPFSEA